MIVSTVKGNLIVNAQQGMYKAIVQGCNCFCVMGAGLAPQIAKAWPLAEIADNATVRGDLSKLGSYTQHFDEDRNLRVINMYTQGGTRGTNGNTTFAALNPDVNYKAIAKGFACLNDTQTDRFRSDCRKVGIPLIGSGLAGGHWEAIKTIINLVTLDLDIELVIYEPPAAVKFRSSHPSKIPAQFKRVLSPAKSRFPKVAAQLNDAVTH